MVKLQGALAVRLQELETALSQVKQLRGLLHICSYWKKIRDDRNYWNRLENYLGKHTDVQFSHGICPDCYEKVRKDIEGRPLVTEWFFEDLFSDLETVDQFEAAVERFRVAAMWLYGNFKFAHRLLGTADQEAFRNLIAEAEPKTPPSGRLEFNEIEDIPDGELLMLGYISSGRVIAIDGLIDELKRMVAHSAQAVELWRGLGGVATKFQEALRSFDLRLEIAGAEIVRTLPGIEKLLERLTTMRPVLHATLKAAQEKCRRNTHRYLTLSYLDVYVATSMRSDTDFVEQHSFVKRVFSDSEVTSLHLLLRPYAVLCFQSNHKGPCRKSDAPAS